MIELHSWTTPNGRKISIALEEMGLEYCCIPVDISADEQLHPDFLAISPNNKIPAIRDGDFTLFESGAILLYLAEKSGRFVPDTNHRGRNVSAPDSSTTTSASNNPMPHSERYWQMMQWLMWQMGGFGPMVGQAHHFLHYQPGQSDYAEQRYRAETERLYRVLDKQLDQSEFMVSELSIADFAVWPWVARFDYHQIDLNHYPNVKRWYLQLAERPAFQRGYKQPKDVGDIPLPKQ